jgi:hypothetical protein
MERKEEIRHLKIYHEPGRFGGWPANHGIWSWGDEILVGFCTAWYMDRGSGHAVDPDKPEHHVLARSLDGGETWELEYPEKQGALLPRGSHAFWHHPSGCGISSHYRAAGTNRFYPSRFCNDIQDGRSQGKRAVPLLLFLRPGKKLEWPLLCLCLILPGLLQELITWLRIK